MGSVQAARQTQVSDDKPVFSGQREGFIPDEQFPEALENIKNSITQLFRLMKKGVFHLPLCAESEQTCYNCRFGHICRKDQLRLDRLRSSLREMDNIYFVKEIY